MRATTADLLQVGGLTKSFSMARALIPTMKTRPVRRVMALDGVSFSVAQQEILGLVGESGSGKTTLARCLVRLVEPDSGEVIFDGQDVVGANGEQVRSIRRRMQMVYQD